MSDDAATQSRAPARVACVCGVVVTYRPELVLLAAQLDALAPQIGHLLVVDNASPKSSLRDLCAKYPDVELLTLPGNLGLATALNRGIARAQGLPGISHVLLMDQDSVPEAGMVVALATTLQRLAADTRVAAVGPCYRDPREVADTCFVRIRFPFNRKLRCTGDCEAVDCDFLITSGSLIPLAILDAIGGMDDLLFIDNVDLDWSFRATAAGFRLYGVCGARMLHHHGAERQHVPGLANGIVVHTPRRLFYMMRNRVLLYRRKYTPVRWIAQDLPRVIVKLLLFSLLVAPRRANLRGMLAGLRTGIGGRSSPPPEGL